MAKEAEAEEKEWTLEGHARVMGLGALVAPAAETVLPGDVTPGCTQKEDTADEKADELMTIEQQAHEDQKRHKAVIDGCNVKRDLEDDVEVAGNWRKELETEKSKRRDLEDTVDELKLEVSFNREATARATHAVGKLVVSNLQAAERADQVTILVIKKKAEKMRPFFEAYKQLQVLAQKEAAIVGVSNNGPMVSVQICAPEKVRDVMAALKDWQRAEKVEVAIFKGKCSMTQMLELPIRAAHSAMLQTLDMDPRTAKENGLSTSWLDQDRRWSMCYNGQPLIRGKINVETLEAEVHVSMQHFHEQGAVDVIAAMKKFEKTDKNGCVFELSYTKLEAFCGTEQWGRQGKGGKGKGFGGKGS